MPEAAAIEAPPATATPTINVTAKPVLPVHQPTPEVDMASTREAGRKMFRQKLEERFGPTPKPEKVPKPKEQPAEPSLDEKPKPDASQPDTEDISPETETKETPPPEAKEGQPDQTPPAEKTEKGKKESPWKIVEKWKERSKALEKELADVKSSILPENDTKALKTRLEQLEASLKEKEDYLRLHHYQQSDEYRTKYEQPWEAAWQKTAKQMAEIMVTDPTTGAERQANVHDIERLVNSPLGAARKMANEMFGDFADDAMAMRGKIVELFEAREEAITKAKSEGANWQKTQTETQAKQAAALRQEMAETWQKTNETYLADPKVGHYFKPHEGDQEWNQRLSKGAELVDKAFATLKPDFSGNEPRAEVIKRHAAIRQRAIAFGPLRHAYEQAIIDRDAWKSKYEAITKSTPPTSTQTAHEKGKEAEPADYRSQLRAALLKAAH